MSHGVDGNLSKPLNNWHLLKAVQTIPVLLITSHVSCMDMDMSTNTIQVWERGYNISLKTYGTISRNTIVN
jgi:hypothetical protein